MRILLIVDSYLPDPKATGPMFHSLASELVSRGHEVTILTVSERVDHDAEVDRTEDFSVIRVRAPKLKNINLIRRGFRELRLSTMVWQRARRLLEPVRADLIAFYSPTIFWGPLVRRLKRMWHARAVLILRDIFPQWALDAGHMSRGPHFHLLSYYADLQYKVADRIGIQSPGNRAWFAQNRPHYLNKMGVLYNWTSGAPASNDNLQLAQQLGLDPRIPIFLYGGNLGTAQDPDLLLQVASALEGKAHVLVVGEGLAFAQVEAEARKRTNLTVWPSVSQDRFVAIATQSAVGMVLLNRNLTTHNVPGKLLTYVQAALPVLASVNRDNDLRALLEDSQAGLCSWADEPQQFLSNALQLTDPALRERLAVASESLSAVFSVASAADFLLQVSAPA